MILLKFPGLALIVALTILTGCSSSDTDDGSRETRTYPDKPLDCSVDEMRQWVEANMFDYYLFYNHANQVDLTQYQTMDSLEQLIRDMRVSADRFSYIADAKTTNDLFEEGKVLGFGHNLKRTGETEVSVVNVDPGSPVDDVGIKRGFILSEVNGKSPFGLTESEFDQLFGYNGFPVGMSLQFLDLDGQTVEYDLTSRIYDLQTVRNTSVFNVGGQSVGYLYLESFLETTEPELDQAFGYLGNQGITELVLDLRYNRGGRVDVANKLASLIVGAGPASQNRDFVRFELNRKYQQYNGSMRFLTENNALDLNRLFVLTTDSSCSASELIINSLRPFIEVITIGDTTCGKPYASAGNEACEKSMSALEFSMLNDNGVGNYINGLAADCRVPDGIDRPLGDSTETMLESALGYIERQSCSANQNRQRDSGDFRPLYERPSFAIIDDPLQQ